jgi:hypothetical protein
MALVAVLLGVVPAFATPPPVRAGDAEVTEHLTVRSAA